jgi:hypothetical protein
VIKADSLDAIKGLVRLVLQRERECAEHGSPLTTTASQELTAQLLAVPDSVLLAAIQRHRLESLLHGDPMVGALLPTLGGKLKALARAETMAALALASLTREIAALFERAGIPMLVIKGIPLSLQTTGSLTARGRGDLDLLADPKRLPDAVNLLEQHGFARKPGMCPSNLDSFWGRYSRWAGYEFSLIRHQKIGAQWIDLHWALSNVRAPLPHFQETWDCQEKLNVNGQSVATLCGRHAFQHACAHAAKDQWMCLRNLVDIERLARSSDQESLRPLTRFRMVRFSCAIAHNLSGADLAAHLFDPAETSTARALQEAHLAQSRPWRGQEDGPWKPQHFIAAVARMLRLSINGEDWLRTLLYYTLLPAAFSDPGTGQDRGLAGLLKARIHHFRQRASENQQPNPAANA